MIRSAGPRSLVDLIAIRKNSKTLLIQCKSGNAKLSKKGKTELIKLARSINGTAVYAYRPSPKKIEIEDLTNVRL